MTARDQRVLEKLTIKLTRIEERSTHLRKLIKKGLGFREEEEFLAKEKRKMKGKNFNNKKKEGVISLIMKELVRYSNRSCGAGVRGCLC